MYSIYSRCACDAERGRLYSFGANGDAQLGLDSNASEDRVLHPTLVHLPKQTKIRTLSAGAYHSAYLTGLHYCP